MRLCEVAESSEFENKANSLRQMFLVQKAACHQYLVYADKLFAKYHLSPFVPLDWATMRAANLPSPSFSESSVISTDDMNKYKQNYHSMVKAKAAYEKAGGDYK